jgi:hypothetical protein
MPMVYEIVCFEAVSPVRREYQGRTCGGAFVAVDEARQKFKS